jgi:hypothetical protein
MSATTAARPPSSRAGTGEPAPRSTTPPWPG